MDSIIAIIFGAVQGLTEFVPVSSSGHLIIFHEMFPGFEVTDEIAFDVSLHIGSLVALIIFFWKDIISYLAAWISSFSGKRPLTPHQHLAWMIIVAIIPAGLVGLLFEDIIEQVFRSTLVVVIMLIAVALLFILVERVNLDKLSKKMDHIGWKQALFIGLMQVIALIPGTSRSGITMIAGMMMKLTRAEAARFSFLISIPLIAGAGLKKTLDLVTVGISPSEIPILALGTLSAGTVGYIAIAFLLKYLSTRSLNAFAYYRIVLGIVVLLIFVVGN